MTFFAVLKLVHVASAMWLVSGLLGRAVALGAARRYPDIRTLKAIADVSGRLENLMIAPGYLAVLVTGVAAAIAGGYALLGPVWLTFPLVFFAVGTLLTPVVLGHDRRWGQALEEAARLGAITDRLRGYLERGAMLRRYAPDIVGVALIVALMVLKPF